MYQVRPASRQGARPAAQLRQRPLSPDATLLPPRSSSSSAARSTCPSCWWAPTSPTRCGGQGGRGGQGACASAMQRCSRVPLHCCSALRLSLAACGLAACDCRHPSQWQRHARTVSLGSSPRRPGSRSAGRASRQITFSQPQACAGTPTGDRHGRQRRVGEQEQGGESPAAACSSVCSSCSPQRLARAQRVCVHISVLRECSGTAGCSWPQ